MIGASSNKPLEIRKALFTVCLMLIACCVSSCSMPSLETPQCNEARDSVKEFYSWYLGTDAEMRSRQRDFYDRYVSRTFDPAQRDGLDAFFLSDTTPTTFKVGKCEVTDDTHAKVQVQLYWRQERKTDQKEIYVKTVKSEDTWLIESVDSQ